MNTIYKYPLTLQYSQVVSMPKGAKILSCQMQGDVICLWATVDPSQPNFPRYITIYETGQKVHSTESTYLGTVLEHQFVWHVFEEKMEQTIGSTN
jgi:hypothetical protein